MKRQRNALKLLDAQTLVRLAGESLRRLHPRRLAHNPVMFVVGVGTLVTLWLTGTDIIAGRPWGFDLAITLTLLFTLLFANAAEALAEAQGRAQAESLRSTRKQLVARRVRGDDEESVPATALRRGDRVRVLAGELIPADGEIIEGAASINESAVTGESAPVLREAGTDNSGVSAGTKLLTDSLLVEVTVESGQSLLDRMIALVESAKRQKTPNEIALTVLLSALTMVFLIVVATLVPFAAFVGAEVSVPVLVALLVCLIPTTIGGLLPAIGIAGMDRAMRANLVAKSGKAVEVAGNIDTLLLDKTGTITHGDRQASDFLPLARIAPEQLREAAMLSSLADPTPEGKSIVALAKSRGATAEADPKARVLAFSAKTRLSGIDQPDGRRIRKGAPDAIRRFVTENGGSYPDETTALVERVARGGATPLVVAQDDRVLGVVPLSDIIKTGIKERFQRLHAMGIRTVLITGDNPLTAAAIAAEAGVADYIAEATPEDKLEYIRREQAQGRLVAMMGDGTNDAPALAQADLGLAMNSGTQAAKEAGNMVDLDSDPTKLLEVVEIGKQLLVTRGALTTFSLANDVAKYFAILPAIFVASVPAMQALDIMQLNSPATAVLAAVIFNALVIPALIPFALRGVRLRPVSADALLRRNLLIYGLGGLVLPFPAIKLIDLGLGLVM
ncbi:potassium-transporting ATPase subunit KdpB [Allochromatium vinosum]|uniref:Potassium-transporting ATPase ATP-binding subunit n=1 Tax=Allochromatium vinosum (strain ATCC 17899 / DSM 180 / NBRC 103801 / NCIMB 10441 / D) TaxID=572477 RepID=D3RSD9_ALLVD|nr:potassium-transporting ATPase subunit KdpB [Allochromatium vinosum]ADC62098.1 K+-transporting ATPase, B subunit [Allochromatium vinosum DSM 180]